MKLKPPDGLPSSMKAWMVLIYAGLFVVVAGIVGLALPGQTTPGGTATPLNTDSIILLLVGVGVLFAGATVWLIGRPAKQPSPKWSTREEVWAVIIVVLVLLLSAISQQAASVSHYTPSSCIPVVINGCAGYTASSYYSDSSGSTGVVWLGIIIAVAAYYLGKSRGRVENTTTSPAGGDSAPTPASGR